MKTQYGFTEFENINEFKTWLGKQKVSREITRLQVHHMWMPDYSCWPKDNALRRQYNTKTYHMNTNKWGDIAQHFSIFPDGHIVTGRSLNSTPIGIKGWNTNAICVEIYGNFDKSKDKMTKAQKEAEARVAELQAAVDAKDAVIAGLVDAAAAHAAKDDADKAELEAAIVALEEAVAKAKGEEEAPEEPVEPEEPAEETPEA